jgi:hypothetical protein
MDIPWFKFLHLLLSEKGAGSSMPDQAEWVAEQSKVFARAAKWFALVLFTLSALTAIPRVSPAADETTGGKQPSRPLITELGTIIGYGNGTITEGDYTTLLLIAHIGMDINRYIPALRDNRGTLSFFFEPQFNPVLTPSSQYEFGVGIGFQYSYPLSEFISPYILAVTGPQYISVHSTHQADGLNFASAIGAGLYFSLTQNMSLNLGYRYRHVSNANLKQPNGGINSQIGLMGLAFFF